MRINEAKRSAVNLHKYVNAIAQIIIYVFRHDLNTLRASYRYILSCEYLLGNLLDFLERRAERGVGF